MEPAQECTQSLARAFEDAVWCERCVRARRETRQLHPWVKEIAGQTNQEGFQQYSEDGTLGIGTRKSQRVLQRAAKDSKSSSNSSCMRRSAAHLAGSTKKKICTGAQSVARAGLWATL